jgi:hypothetical protein
MAWRGRGVRVQTDLERNPARSRSARRVRPGLSGGDDKRDPDVSGRREGERF